MEMKVKFSLRFDFRNTSLSILAVIFFTTWLLSGLLHAQQKQKFYDDLFSVTFPNEKDGWACGRWGSILYTNDGGKRWSSQNSSTDYTLTSIYFVDPNNGWAVGEGGTIVHTRDGGKTWEKQESPVPFYLMKVYFATPSKGWIVTEQTHILFTDDGGRKWNIQFKDQDFILKSLSFCDPLHGWAVGEYGYIYKTNNGGTTWEKQAGFFNLSSRTGEIEGGTFLFGVVAFDPQTAWAIGIDGCVIRTTDGGKTWNEVAIGAPKTQLFCITTNKKDTILIGGKGTFMSSHDRGKTWKAPEFEPPIIYNWIYGLASRGGSGFVAVGGEGAIYLNVSTSWQRIAY
jgi:photosystem II stability/assembly factor-like uncharacterized protein